MTSPQAGADDLVRRRKRLKFRSWHRGTKEMDLLLGPFADACLDGFDSGLLGQYEALLEQPEPDLYEWILGRAAPPADARSSVLDRLIAHYADPNAR